MHAAVATCLSFSRAHVRPAAPGKHPVRSNPSFEFDCLSISAVPILHCKVTTRTPATTSLIQSFYMRWRPVPLPALRNLTCSGAVHLQKPGSSKAVQSGTDDEGIPCRHRRAVADQSCPDGLVRARPLWPDQRLTAWRYTICAQLNGHFSALVFADFRLGETIES